MKRIIPMIVLLMIWGGSRAQQADLNVRGKIYLIPDNEPAIGASIRVKDTQMGTVADHEGNFSIELPIGIHLLVVSSIGYKPQEVSVLVPSQNMSNIQIYLEENELGLSEIEVFSTGYQEIPKERATGSFVQLDNELINRRITTNILDRLEDVTPGLIFNRDRAGTPDDFSIRGTSTFFSDPRPLIVIDNFPYDGPLENINPNDIESITVLRDAAAASIWGAKAGNGVVVITTKKGKRGDVPKISIVANTTVVEPRDLHYENLMSVNAFIDAEKILFARGQFADRENNLGNLTLSPVVETLIMQRDGVLTPLEAENIIEGYRNSDIRKDLAQYYYRPEVRQQYSIGIRGGANYHNYNISVGVDRNQQEIITRNMSRITLNAQNSFSLINDKLKVNSGIYFTQVIRKSETEVPSSNYLYEPLVDDEGNSLPIIRDLNSRFVADSQERGFLDWTYKPIDEIGSARNNFIQNDLRINSGISYNFLSGFEAELMYQYWINNSNNEQTYLEEGYFARNLINEYSTFTTAGNLVRNIPRGGVRDFTENNSNSHHIRAQLKYNGKFGEKGHFTGLVGGEVKDFQTNGNTNRWYGYDHLTGASEPVDYLTVFQRSSNNSFLAIPRRQEVIGTVNRFLSAYTNLSYTYDHRYVISFSARQDGSNIFGVNANQRLVPLWSSGINWNISEESFYSWEAVPFVRIRSTYGFNGNVNPSLSALPTAFIRQGSSIGNLPYLALNNPGNPDLRWEKVAIMNLALDFETKNGRLSGNIEYYSKNGIDLIGTVPFPSNTGVNTFTGNFSKMMTRGLDINLISRNIAPGKSFRWTTNYFLSKVSENVTDFEGLLSAMSYFNYGSGSSGDMARPRVGFPLHAVYTIPYAGLDPDTGDPRGFLNGEPSTNAGAVVSGMAINDLEYQGYGRPTVFGALRNDFTFKNFTVSANVSYRMGYVFRRPTVSYFNLFNGWVTHKDFEGRWQNPGDEILTDVPSLPEFNDTNRETLFRNSSALIEKGDHIRLQDIRLSYGTNFMQRHKIERIEIYAFMDNLGILWKATDLPLDPDFRFDRPRKSFTLGVNLSL